MEKRKVNEIQSIKYRKKILETKGEYSVNDFGWFMFYFLPRTELNYNTYIKEMEFNGVKNCKKVREYFFSTEPIWNDYNDFLTKIEEFQ